MNNAYDLIVVGGGPAGLTAGLYGARGGLKTLILERGLPGGQAATTDVIENYPGFPQGIGGPELMQKFAEQAQRFGASLITEEVEEINLPDGDQTAAKQVVTNRGTYESPALILAMGSSPRELGAAGEKEFRGRGVSYCATCDGAFFKGRKVMVIGGGDSALEEALFLTQFASQVVIVHRRDAFRAAQILEKRARSHPKIDFRLKSVVERIQGTNKVESVRLRRTDNGQVSEEAADGVFIFIGTIPNTAFLSGKVHLDENGYIITDELLATSIPGVFAAGDVRKKFLRQVSTAVGDGAWAAMAAQKYISDLRA